MSKKSGGEGGAGGSSLIGHLLGEGDLDHDGAQRPPGTGKDAAAEDGEKEKVLLAETLLKNGGNIEGGGEDGGGKAAGGRNGPDSSHGATKRKVKPKPPPTRKAPPKKEAPVVTRQEASKFMDVHGSVMFLRGKLKEMLDLMGGPDEIRAKQQSRAQIDEMANFLASLIKGEDETAKRIEHGLSLTDASRHRPDISLGDPMQSLKRFVDVRLAALRMFGTDGQNFLVDKWISSPAESFLSNAVLALLNYLDVLSGHSREILTLLEIMNCFFDLCNPVLNGRMETMVLEPDLVWMNMRAAVEVCTPSLLPHCPVVHALFKLLSFDRNRGARSTTPLNFLICPRTAGGVAAEARLKPPSPIIPHPSSLISKLGGVEEARGQARG
jgi:hypothetical protein